MTNNDTVVFPEAGTVSIERRPRPAPGDDEVLIETRKTLVSTGTELAALGGSYQTETFPFEQVGYSNVGEIVAVGENVVSRRVGERVATTKPHAEYVVAAASDCRIVPDGVTDAEATFFHLGAIAMNGVRRGRLDWGETCIVYGLGLVGQLIARTASLAGAKSVLGVDIAPSRLPSLPDDPAVTAVDSNTNDPSSLLKERNHGRLADVVFEATGSAAAISEEFGSLRREGRLVVVSSPRETGEFDYYWQCHRPGYEIIGAHVTTHPSTGTPRNPWTVERHHELFFDLLQSGRLDVRPLITHEENYRRAPRCYRMLEADRTQAIGVVLDWR